MIFQVEWQEFVKEIKMRNRIFEVCRNHSRLTIEKEDEQIIFVETSCFDFNTGEWDTFVATIPKKDFIEGAKEFLKKGACKVGKLKMDTKGAIYICVGERPEIFCSQQGKVSWIIVNKFDIEQFLQVLKRVTAQEELKNG